MSDDRSILSPEQLRALRSLSVTEIEALVSLVPHVTQIKEDAEMRAARRLVWQARRQALIATAAAVSAVVLLWDRVEALFRWGVKLLTGGGP